MQAGKGTIASLIFLIWSGWVLGQWGPASKPLHPDKGKLKREGEAGSQVEQIGGKLLEEWIADISARDPSKRVTAIRTVLLFGPERALQAVPALLKELKKHSSAYPLDLSVQANAIMALGSILGQSKNPDPKLVAEAVTQLKRMLSAQEEDMVRFRAAEALAQLGPAGRPALLPLLYALKDARNWETRHAAAVALGRVALPAGNPQEINLTEQERQELDRAIGELANRVRLDPAAQVRLACLHTLLTLGRLAGPNVRPVLLQALTHAASQDPEKAVQVWANLTYLALTYNPKAPPDAQRLGHIGKLLVEAPEAATRVQAAQALALIGEPAKSQLPRLIQALNDSDREVVATTLLALAHLGEKGLSKVGEVLATSKEPALRLKALEALSLVGSKARGQMPQVLKALNDPDKEVAAAALLVLPRLGEEGVEQTGKLLANSKDKQVRIQAARALGQAGPQAKSQLPLLLSLLSEPDQDLAAAGVWALAHMGSAASPALPQLRQLAVNPQRPPELRQLASQAIDAIQKDNKN
jgi:HEAT repeat protein